MFAHPLMLAWCAAAAVPVVLRLAGRAAARTVDFSAMLFLPGGTAAAAAGGRGWVLLLVRSAALGLLAVAAARPVLPAAWSGVPTAGLRSVERTTVAVVVDDAAGMGDAHDGPTRLERAKQVALGVLRGLGRGDRVVIVPDPVPPDWVGGKPSADLSAAGAAVSGLRPLRRAADVADALARAAAAMAGVAGRRQVVVVCGGEAAAWRNVTDGFGRTWRAARPPPVVVAAVGGEAAAADNVSVESVRAVAPPLVRDVPGAVRVAVRNWGGDAVADVPITVWTATRTLGEATVSVPPHGLATVDVPVRPFGDDGPRLVSAAVRPAGRWLGPTFDDRRDGVVAVIAPPRVLVVTDDPAATFPLRAALAPAAAAGVRGGDTAVVTVAGPGSWTPPDPAVVDVVVLADAADVWADRADDLRRFVEDGGGLVIAPGRHVVAAEYDDALGPVAGVGMLPTELAAPRPTRGGGVLRLADVDHPVLGFADGATADPAAGVRVDRAFGLIGRPGGRVLATVDGRPAVVAADGPGAGRVVLFTVPLDDTWATWSRSGVFLPLVQSAVRWAGGGAADAWDAEGVAGRPIVVRVGGVVAAASVQLPDGRREVARVVRRGDRSEVRFERTGQPGTYRIRYRVGRRERSAFVVVTGPETASDLTPLSAGDWRAVGRRVGFDRVEPTAGAVLAAVGGGRGGPEGWAVGVAGVVLLLVGETLLGRRWSGAAGRKLG